MPGSKPRTRHDAAIIRMASEGRIAHEICKEIGENYQFLYSRLHRLGLPPILTKGERLEREIRALAEKGQTLAEISAAVNRTYHYVVQIVSKAGISVRRSPTYQASTFDHAKAVAAVKDGATLRSVGERFGVSHQRIAQVIQKAGASSARSRSAA